MSIKKTFRLAELTMGEMKEVLPQKPVILLPMGSFEDQGPHAPTGDYLSADAMAVKIAEAATAKGIPTFVAPPIPFGGDDGFSASPGGITLSQGTLTAVISDMLASLMRSDITRIVVINGHGGNVGPIRDATAEVYRAGGPLIPSFYLWRVGYGLLPAILGADVAKKAAGHGCDPLTSVAMHLLPGLVREDLIPAVIPKPTAHGVPVAGFSGLKIGGADIDAPLHYHEAAVDGVWGGDPSLCSAATGAALTEKLSGIGAEICAWVVSQQP